MARQESDKILPDPVQYLASVNNDFRYSLYAGV